MSHPVYDLEALIRDVHSGPTCIALPRMTFNLCLDQALARMSPRERAFHEAWGGTSQAVDRRSFKIAGTTVKPLDVA